MIPIPYRWAALAASLVVAFAWGYDSGRDSRAVEIGSITAVANATTDRNRKITQEAANVQKLYLASWTANRDASRAAWVRLQADRNGRVPVICPESGSAEADRGNGLEDARREADRVLHAATDALERGEEIERTLTLCQAELRQCAGMR